MPRRTAGTLVVIAFCAYAHPPQLVSVQVADARSAQFIPAECRGEGRGLS